MENPFQLILEKLEKIELAINKLNLSTQTSLSNDEQLLNIDEVAEYLKLTKPTIYGRVHTNKIPFYKVGNKLQFKKSEIDEYFFSNRNLTDREIDKKADDYIYMKSKIRNIF